MKSFKLTDTSHSQFSKAFPALNFVYVGFIRVQLTSLWKSLDISTAPPPPGGGGLLPASNGLGRSVIPHMCQMVL